MGKSWIAGAALIVSVALAGCAAPDSAPEQTPPVGGPVTPSPTAVAHPAGFVVATGTFSDAVGHVTGEVAITSTGTAYELSITGFSTSIDTFDLSATDVPIAAGETCFTERWSTTWGTPRGTEITEIEVADPFSIAAVVVTTLPVESSTDCPFQYVGYANLTVAPEAVEGENVDQ